jgi:hypothetical protein
MNTSVAPLFVDEEDVDEEENFFVAPKCSTVQNAPLQ